MLIHGQVWETFSLKTILLIAINRGRTNFLALGPHQVQKLSGGLGREGWGRLCLTKQQGMARPPPPIQPPRIPAPIQPPRSPPLTAPRVSRILSKHPCSLPPTTLPERPAPIQPSLLSPPHVACGRGEGGFSPFPVCFPCSFGCSPWQSGRARSLSGLGRWGQGPSMLGAEGGPGLLCPCPRQQGLGPLTAPLQPPLLFAPPAPHPLTIPPWSTRSGGAIAVPPSQSCNHTAQALGELWLQRREGERGAEGEGPGTSLHPTHHAAGKLGWLLCKAVLTPLPGRSLGARGKGPAGWKWPVGRSLPPSAINGNKSGDWSLIFITKDIRERLATLLLRSSSDPLYMVSLVDINYPSAKS